MSAKEMFEKLGYEDTSKKFHRLIRFRKQYIKNDSIVEDIICIELGSNEVQVARIYDKYNYGTFHLTKEELQAINKQVEELGWLGSDKEIAQSNKILYEISDTKVNNAIEYINDMLYPIGTCVNGSDLPYESIESLLNILQNGSEEK